MTEFCLMCGENAPKKIEENLLKYTPKILDRGGYQPAPEKLTEKDLLTVYVLEALDKCVRPTGVGANTPAIYSVNEVSCTCTVGGIN